MKFLSFLIPFFFATPSYAVKMAGCQLNFKKERLCASIEWKKKPVLVEAPTEKDQAELELKFWDPGKTGAKGPYTTPPGDVTVVVSMPEMDHGSEPTNVQAGKKGIYDVSHIYLTMGGNWEIRVNLKKDDKIVDSAKINYTLK